MSTYQLSHKTNENNELRLSTRMEFVNELLTYKMNYRYNTIYGLQTYEIMEIKLDPT